MDSGNRNTDNLDRFWDKDYGDWIDSGNRNTDSLDRLWEWEYGQSGWILGIGIRMVRIDSGNRNGLKTIVVSNFGTCQR